jgi:ribosome recycling factor
MAIQNEQFDMIMMETMERADKTISVLNGEYITIRAGRANPHILDKVLVDYYGTPTPINQVGNLSVTEGRCLVIAPWDASMLKIIEKQLIAENLGINPVNDGKVIRLVFPALTEERRKELVKQIKKMAEDSKVAIRNIRRDAMDALKKMKNNKELSEDEHAVCEKDIDKFISESIDKVDKLCADKEKDVLSV